MMNILEQSEALKGIPEDALMREMQQPTGSMPQFLVLTELKRRKRMRDEYNRRKAQDIPTVAEEVVMGAGMPQEGIMQMSKSMAPKSSIAQNTGQQEATPREPTMGMASGGLLSLAKGDKLGKPVVYNGDTYMVDDKGQVYLNGRRVSNRKLRDEVLQKASSDVAGDVDDSPTPQAKTGSQLLDEAQASMTGSQMFSPSNIPSVGDSVIRPPISGFPPPEGSVDLPVFDATAPDTVTKRGMPEGFSGDPRLQGGILDYMRGTGVPAAAEPPEYIPSSSSPTGFIDAKTGRPVSGSVAEGLQSQQDQQDLPNPRAVGTVGFGFDDLTPNDLLRRQEGIDKREAQSRDLTRMLMGNQQSYQDAALPEQTTDELMPRAIGTVGFGFDDLTPNDLLRRQEGIDRREKERGERAEAFRREEGRFYPSPKEADFYAMDTVLRNLKKQRAALGEGIMQGRAGPLTGATPLVSNTSALPPPESGDIAAIAAMQSSFPQDQKVEYSDDFLNPQITEVEPKTLLPINATPPGYKSPQERFSEALSKRPRLADEDGTAGAETIETETVTQDLPDELRFEPFNNTVEKGDDGDSPLAPETSLRPRARPEKGDAGDDTDGGGGASRTTGGTGGTGGSPLRSRIEQLIADREKDREADKWMALAETGLALMASSNPTLGGAIGEAGLVGVGTMRKAKQDYDKDMLELLTIQEDMRQADLDYSASLAAAAARGSVDNYTTSQQVDDLTKMYTLEQRTLDGLKSQLSALDDPLDVRPDEVKAAEAARLRNRIEKQDKKVLAYETRLKQTIGGRINLSD